MRNALPVLRLLVPISSKNSILYILRVLFTFCRKASWKIWKKMFTSSSSSRQFELLDGAAF